MEINFKWSHCKYRVKNIRERKYMYIQDAKETFSIDLVWMEFYVSKQIAMIYKSLCRKLKIRQHEPRVKQGVNLCTAEG